MPFRYAYRKVRDFFVYRVLHADDTPHRIALGVAIGIFVTWTPTIGLQMILTVLLCWVLRANKAVGVPFVWISNPLTIVPIYYPNYMVGCWLLGGDYSDFNFIEAVSTRLDVGWLEQIRIWLEATWKVFWPLWAGSLVVGAALGVITYPIVYWSVIKYRRLKQVLVEHLAHRHEGQGEAALADGPADGQHQPVRDEIKGAASEKGEEGENPSPSPGSDGEQGPDNTSRPADTAGPCDNTDSDAGTNSGDDADSDADTDSGGDADSESEDATDSNSTPGQRPGL